MKRTIPLLLVHVYLIRQLDCLNVNEDHRRMHTLETKSRSKSAPKQKCNGQGIDYQSSLHYIKDKTYVKNVHLTEDCVLLYI